MGGLGSGRQSRSDAVGFVESHLRIDVRRWQREGLLEPKQSFSRCWRKNEAVADFTVNVEVRGDVVVLTYEIWHPDRPRGEQWEPIQLRVGLTFTPLQLWRAAPLVPMPDARMRPARRDFASRWPILRVPRLPLDRLYEPAYE